ncbi:unnamed protein product [Polarella glacialis]|uniref:Uncharacterized protein n=1 Tax=Polarella glacialis TaxID=89957 RepID=A0A813HE64_POLGL|nr:unnamed protein product [Polarella glacialis]
MQPNGPDAWISMQLEDTQMSVRRLSERARTGGSLRTLGGDTYSPSGITLRPEDIGDPRRFRKLPSGGGGAGLDGAGTSASTSGQASGAAK